MGAVGSRLDDGGVYMRDQARLSITRLTITNRHGRVILHITPNAYPTTRAYASREPEDPTVIEYVQDPEPSPTATTPQFLLKCDYDDELTFQFTCVVRQGEQSSPRLNEAAASPDTTITGLTFVSASTQREVDNLVTREFEADPNLHKNANVHLVGDFATNGAPSVTFDWAWKWKPPKPYEDRGGGWRNTCTFVEYNQRAHRLDPLASFSFWVSSPGTFMHPPSSPITNTYLAAPPKSRSASSQSLDSRVSGSDGPPDDRASPTSETLTLAVPPAKETIKVDLACQRPTEDMSATEDGPLFRATMKQLEQKTGNMRARMKKVLRKAEAAHNAQAECNAAIQGFMEALREASTSNANAVQPAIEHYFNKIAREIWQYERQNAVNLQKIIIDPLTKLYNLDIKQAEAKKRDFEEESKDYYAYVSRYLGQRQDTMKDKKRAESDTKYQTKRRNFELKRFDYSSFMQDLHGGRKEQEVLSHLTRYADAQTQSYLSAAKKVELLLPQLEALSSEVSEADKEYQYQRREREEKRRNLEKSSVTYVEPESLSAPVSNGGQPGHNGATSDSDLGRADSTASTATSANGDFGRSPSLSHHLSSSPNAGARFKGIRDLEEKDYSQLSAIEKTGTQRKEGLLWALSRPGGHVDPKALKQAWHKFWIVLDQGKLSEYSNWKQRLDLHMEPIDLRMASVREARNAERRFCFEVITPQFKRVYQATSEEDMSNWIYAINNALQSAVEGRGVRDAPATPTPKESSIRRDIGSILTGKSSSLTHGHHSSGSVASNASVFRRTTVGARPAYVRTSSGNFDDNPDRLLKLLRDSDQGNCWCADCGSGVKTEWVSINLAIILCIECSGIHRSLGTHISKIRSLTLDIHSFTTDIVELLLLVGNRVSNMVWEGTLDPTLKPLPQATREQRLKFITAKYVDKAFVRPIVAGASRYGTPDETLVAAIRTTDVPEVIHALAVGANPNVLDKVRGTHPVYLALASADPASPSPSVSPAPSDSPPSVAFPLAEMLMQNGAVLPPSLPAFPLSRNAVLYIDQKTGKVVPSHDAPGLFAPQLGADTRQRERESRLQKRVSAAGRLAKAPIRER